MKNEYPYDVRLSVQRAAKALRQTFKEATKAGMHPDEFWYWLGNAVEPKRQIRPRCVSAAGPGIQRRTSKARADRTNSLYPRNQEIRMIVERSLELGEAHKAIYARIKKQKGIGERQVRKICRAELQAHRRKTLE